MKFTRLLLVAALAVTGGVVGAQPAHAAETAWLNTVGDGGGYAAASVTAAFLSRTTVDLKGWIRDVCPADGKGAYLYVNYLWSDGWSYNPKPVVKKTNGCSTTKVPFDPAPVTHGDQRNPLRAVRVKVCEYDANGGGGMWCDYHTFDNWRVG